MLKEHGGRIWDIHLKDQKKISRTVVAFGPGRQSQCRALRWVPRYRFEAPINIEQEAPGWDRDAVARRPWIIAAKCWTS